MWPTAVAAHDRRYVLGHKAHYVGDLKISATGGVRAHLDVSDTLTATSRSGACFVASRSRPQNMAQARARMSDVSGRMPGRARFSVLLFSRSPAFLLSCSPVFFLSPSVRMHRNDLFHRVDHLLDAGDIKLLQRRGERRRRVRGGDHLRCGPRQRALARPRCRQVI